MKIAKPLSYLLAALILLFVYYWPPPFFVIFTAIVICTTIFPIGNAIALLAEKRVAGGADKIGRYKAERRVCHLTAISLGSFAVYPIAVAIGGITMSEVSVSLILAPTLCGIGAYGMVYRSLYPILISERDVDGEIDRIAQPESSRDASEV